MHFLAKLYHYFLKALDFFKPAADLLARLWVSYIFLKAGILKLQSWNSTLYLFEHVFHVPLLSPTVAAVIGTGAEIILPIMLILGLGGRLTVFVFFCYNAIAVISYPQLLTPDGAQGLAQHINWGLLLMLLMVHGSGKLSIDYWINQKFGAAFRAKFE